MISAEYFGVTEKGERVMLFRLSGRSAAVEIISFGCAIRSVRVPDREGRMTEICAGYDTLREYELGDAQMGAVVGRVSGRITGARFTLGGREYRLSPNAGENLLHGGAAGFSRRVWDWEINGDSLVLSRTSPDGEEGFPGTLRVSAAYTLTDDNELILDYRAVSDRDTYCSLTNHAYWHLGARAEGLRLSAASEVYVEAGPDLTPTGRLLPVSGTPFDFRSPALIGDRVVDHSFPVNGEGLRRVCTLENPANGVGLTVSSTLPSIHVYTADGLPDPRSCVALEAQYIPNGMHSDVFPSPLLRQGDAWKHRTVYKFEQEKGD